MDSMSYRNNRPPQRSSEPEPVPAPSPQPASVPVSPEPVAPARKRQSAKSGNTAKRSRRPLLIIVVIVIVILVAITGWSLFGRSGGATGIEGDKYQAVFLTNNEFWFGKLSRLNGDHMQLTDIYYLKSQTDTQVNDDETPSQAAASSENDFQLIKLGGEVYGPEDKMIIPVGQILHYENLKSDGKVAKGIEQYKSTNK